MNDTTITFKPLDWRLNGGLEEEPHKTEVTQKTKVKQKEIKPLVQKKTCPGCFWGKNECCVLPSCFYKKLPQLRRKKQ